VEERASALLIAASKARPHHIGHLTGSDGGGIGMSKRTQGHGQTFSSLIESSAQISGLK
jgi:hypothetical protein